MRSVKVLAVAFFIAAQFLFVEQAFAWPPNITGCLKTSDGRPITAVLKGYPWIAWTHSGDAPYRNNGQMNHRPMVRYVRSQPNPEVCGNGAYFIFPSIQSYSVSQLGSLASTLIDSDLDGTPDTYTIKYADNKDAGGNNSDPKGFPIGGDYGATFNMAYNPQHIIAVLPKGNLGIMSQVDYNIPYDKEFRGATPISNPPATAQINDLTFAPDANNPTGSTGGPGNPGTGADSTGFVGLNSFVYQDTGTCTGTDASCPSEYVAQYRVGPDPTKFGDADWKPYTAGDIDYDLTQSSPGTGDKKVYYQFKSNKGTVYPTSPKLATITLVGSDINAGNLNCTIDPSSTGARFQISNASNLGRAGAVVSVGTSMTDTSLTSKTTITNWTDTSATGLITDSSVAVGKIYYLQLKRTEDNVNIYSGPTQCTVNSADNKLSLGASIFCKTPNKKAVDNVDLTVYPRSASTGTKATEKVTISQDGIISNIKYQFAPGSLYQISLKALHGIRRVSAQFTAGAGTTTIYDSAGKQFDLFTGDLDDNGVVNNLDRSKLISAWASSAGASALSTDYDLNLDGPTNSVDFACMRAYLSKSNDAEPQ